jgi:hypothetical protein
VISIEHKPRPQDEALEYVLGWGVSLFANLVALISFLILAFTHPRIGFLDFDWLVELIFTFAPVTNLLIGVQLLKTRRWIGLGIVTGWIMLIVLVMLALLLLGIMIKAGD